MHTESVVRYVQCESGGEGVYCFKRACRLVSSAATYSSLPSANSKYSSLQVYDAKTMSETPVAKVEMPQRVPLGFHGTWVHTEQLKMQDSATS